MIWLLRALMSATAAGLDGTAQVRPREHAETGKAETFVDGETLVFIFLTVVKDVIFRSQNTKPNSERTCGPS